MNNVRRYRKAAGITQAELASAVGKTTACICQYETGLHNLPIPVAKKMAVVFRCKWNELYEEE